MPRADEPTARRRPPLATAHRESLSRAIWLVLFAVPTAVIVTAALLVPNPIGHGTHVQLGLPPCGFLVATGLPCPGCGLTTAFSYMVRFDVAGAAHANPFGIFLFIFTASAIPVALFGALRGLPVLDTLERLQAEKWAILIAATSLVVWAIRVGRLFL